MKIALKCGLGSIKFNIFKIFVPVIVIFLLSFLVFGAETSTTTTPLNATVSNTVSINLSANALDRGILFGSLSVGTNNNMAENDTTNTGNITDYYIGNGPTSTGNLGFFHNASNLNRQGNPNLILIANLTYESNTSTTPQANNINMSLTTDGAWKMTAALAGIGGTNCTSVPSGGACWTAYWLDVPSNIPDGTYNTTVNMCGNLTFGNTAC